MGPETLLYSPSALRNPQGMSAVRENRPEERQQKRRRGQERRKEQRGVKREEYRRDHSLSGTFLIMFLQDKSHPVAI